LKKNPTLFPWGTALQRRTHRWHRKTSTIHGIFFSGWSILDALSINWKHSKNAHYGGLYQGPKWSIESTDGNRVHLAATGYFGCSSIPNQTPSIHTASPFRTTVIGVVFLPAVDELKSYSHRHPAFASFYAVSALFLKIGISTHQDTPDRKFRRSKFESDAGIDKKGSFFNGLFYYI